jgi:MOSC domain-containing protein YiiM
MMTGNVLRVFVTPGAGQPMIELEHARALPGKGIEGDRYFLATGSFSRWPGSHRELTLIAAEDLEAMHRDFGIDLPPEKSRRNVLTQGIVLQRLVKETFTIGDIELRGMRLCQPCKYLARLTNEPELVTALVNRGGLRAQILTEGVIRPGYTVTWRDEVRAAPPDRIEADGT